MLKEKNNTNPDKKRVDEVRGFFAHLVVYIFVLIMFFLLGIGQNTSFPLLLFLAAAWGMGVALHGIYTLIR